MKNPTQAFLWELWRTSRWSLLGRIVTIGAFVALLAISANEADEPTAQVFRGLVIVLVMITSVFAPTWLNVFDNRRTGFTFQLNFIRPVKTGQLVGIPAIYVVVAAVLNYWLLALLFFALSGDRLPIMGPSATIACAVTCLLAVLWAPAVLIVRAIGVAALIAALAAAAVAYVIERNDPAPTLLAMGKPEYFSLDWHHYLILMVVTAGAFAVTLAGVTRQRHGDRWELWKTPSIRTLPVSRGRDRLWSRWPRFGNRKVVAQAWLETRRLAPTLLTTAVVVPIGMLVFILIVHFFNQTNWHGAAKFWTGGLVLCPILYQFIGVDGSIGLQHKHGSTEFSQFDMCRPLRCDQMILMKIFVIAICSLIGCLVMALIAIFHTLIAGETQQWVQIGDWLSATVGDVPAYWWIVGAIGILLLYISSSSVLMVGLLFAATRPKLYVSCGLVAFAHMILAERDIRGDWNLAFLWTAYGYVVPIVIVVATVVALRKSLSNHFLGRGPFASVACLWLVYAVSTIVLYVKSTPQVPIPTAAVALGFSLLLIPLAATALAPIAWASLRHR